MEVKKFQHRYLTLKPTPEQQHIFNLYQFKHVGLNNYFCLWQDTITDEVFVCGRSPHDNRRFSWDECIYFIVYLI